MTPSKQCPPREQWRKLLDQTLSQPDQSKLENHLENCDRCRETIEVLVADRQSWARITSRLAQQPQEPSPETALQRVIVEAKAKVAVPVTHGESRSAEDTSLEFLSPPESPHCLGRLGPYQIAEIIGRGGMGVVLKGHDPRLNRFVAIKVLAPELASNANSRKRFRREGQAAAAVTHDHVVTIHSVDEANGLPHLVMEYISGQSLEDRIKSDGTLELKEILRIGMQIASGLAAAHAQGLVHRDIKPANILLENGVERVKITDFGLARAVDDVRITKAGAVTGTPEYMSPEQARGEAVDHRSDLFSLGSVLYAMCTGRSPFRAENTPAMIHRVCEETPRAIQEVNTEIPEWLVQVIDQLLAKSPDQRFQSALEVADLLERYLAHLQQPSMVPEPARPRKLNTGIDRPRSSFTLRRLALTAAAAVLLMIAGIGLTDASGLTDVTATVIRIVRGDGTLVVQVDDPKVSVLIDGEELVITGAGANEIRLHPGQHQVRAMKDGKPVHRQVVTIARGGKQMVKVDLEPAPARLLMGATVRPRVPFLFGKNDKNQDGVVTKDEARPAFLHIFQRFDTNGDGRVELAEFENALRTRSGRGQSSFPIAGGRKSNVFIAKFNLENGRIVGTARRASQRFPDVTIRADWSPDGEYLAYTAAPHTLVIRSMRTGEERVIVIKIPIATQTVRWAPDGRSIMLTCADRPGPYSLRGLYRFDVQSGDVTPVEPLAHAVSTPGFQWPVGWSPDGKTVFVDRFRVDSGTRICTILARDLETGQEKELYRVEDNHIEAWSLSPDGRQMALGSSFSDGDKYEARSLMVMSTAGGEPREILRVQEPEAIAVNTIVWSPDGRFVLFGKIRNLDAAKPSGPITELWRVSVEGGPAEKLAWSTHFLLAGLRIHPGGQQIAFTVRPWYPEYPRKPIQPSTESAKSRCISNLKAIGKAIQQFRHKHGELPKQLSDLVTGSHLQDPNLLVCPADSFQGTRLFQAHELPEMACSYPYRFEEVKEQQKYYGDAARLIQCEDQVVGMRFRGMRIPKGAEIKKAYVQFTVYKRRYFGHEGTEQSDLVVHAELSANAQTFTKVKHNISSRKRTAASVKCCLSRGR